MKLSNRLEACAALVPERARLIDVGTDHGYLPVSLWLRGRLESAVATDINSAPLERARQNAQKAGVDHRMDFVLCDGLEAIPPDRGNCIVIAGMGGETIAGILAASPWTTNPELRLILQPMSKYELLRKWLFTNGYRIAEDQLIEDEGKVYQIISASGGEMSANYSRAELLVGRVKTQDELYNRYLEEQRRRLERAIEGLKHAEGEANAVRLVELRQTLDSLNSCTFS